MRDLISRQALIKELKNSSSFYEENEARLNKRGNGVYSGLCEAILTIESQPTAYDVDKVVKQMRELDNVCTGCIHKECGWCSVGERIEIVKGGGTDE